MYLILDCEAPGEWEAALQMSLLKLGLEGQWVEAGWARFLRIPLLEKRRGQDPNPLPLLAGKPGVRRAWLEQEDFVLAGRGWQQEDRRIQVAGREFGSGSLDVIAGPCSVEDETQMYRVAEAVSTAGAGWLRGGAFKPRSNPYQFQGLGDMGLVLLQEAARAHDLRVVTEVLSLNELDAVALHSDVLQVGSRNAQNFPLLKELGGIGKPVLLKRGFGCTVDETLLTAEYVMSHGNPDVILCERGIRSFEHATRFTFDINAIPLIRSRSPLPLIADPAHGTGNAKLVPAVAKAALAAGASGLMFEVHPDPQESLSDADQALSLKQFSCLMDELRHLHSALNRVETHAAQSFA